MVSPATACCCFGVVTVMTLNPDCASKDSFWADTFPELPPVVPHAVISANATMAAAIFVSINSFFICFVSTRLVEFLVVWKIRFKFKILIVTVGRPSLRRRIRQSDHRHRSHCPRRSDHRRHRQNDHPRSLLRRRVESSGNADWKNRYAIGSEPRGPNRRIHLHHWIDYSRHWNAQS